MPKQNWHPDTCGCAFEEDVSGGTVSFSRVLKKCADHAAVPDGDLYAAVMGTEAAPGENLRKNRTIGKLLESTPLGVLQGDGSYTFKSGASVSWTWVGSGKDRALHIAVAGATITAPQKAAAQAWLDAKFGAGKAVVD